MHLLTLCYFNELTPKLIIGASTLATMNCTLSPLTTSLILPTSPLSTNEERMNDSDYWKEYMGKSWVPLFRKL